MDACHLYPNIYRTVNLSDSPLNIIIRYLTNVSRQKNSYLLFSLEFAVILFALSSWNPVFLAFTFLKVIAGALHVGNRPKLEVCESDLEGSNFQFVAIIFSLHSSFFNYVFLTLQTMATGKCGVRSKRLILVYRRSPR